MGALATNRKRVDESFTSQDYRYNSFNYSNRIDTRVSKKPKVSLSLSLSGIETPEKKVNSLSLQSTVSRLQRYPEPRGRFRREVHAPCRVRKFGHSSSGVWSCAEREESMGNALLRQKYDEAKARAFSVFRHVNKRPRERERDDGSDDDVQIIKVGKEVRSSEAEYDDRSGKEHVGLRLVLEDEKADGKGLDNGVVMSSASDGTKLDSLSLHRGRQVYKELWGSVERSFSGKLGYLKSEIEIAEARRRSLELLRSLKKPEVPKRPEEVKKPEEDTFHQPFAPLTAEENKQVQRAFSNANRSKTLVTHDNSNIEITGETLQCLKPGAWLNDEVINVYLELLKEREKREPKKFLNCHFFNTFFYKKLIGGRNGYDYKAVRRWTTQRKLGYGLVDCDKIFVPIHKEVHWCLAVINKKDKKFQYLDSLGGIDSKVLKVLARYYVDEVKDKSGQDVDISAWEYEFVHDLPEQHNGFDCGVFMIKYADFYSRGMGLDFSQENMPYFRLRTAKEILRLKAD